MLWQWWFQECCGGVLPAEQLKESPTVSGFAPCTFVLLISTSFTCQAFIAKWILMQTLGKIDGDGARLLQQMFIETF